MSEGSLIELFGKSLGPTSISYTFGVAKPPYISPIFIQFISESARNISTRWFNAGSLSVKSSGADHISSTTPLSSSTQMIISAGPSYSCVLVLPSVVAVENIASGTAYVNNRVTVVIYLSP